MAQKFAVIDSAMKVTNVILAAPGFTVTGHTLVASEVAKIGDAYDALTGVFIPPTVSPLSPEELRALMPPLNPAQIRLALDEVGITSEAIEAYLGADTKALIEWRSRPSYLRLHPLVIELGPVFGLTPEQIDTLWVEAAKL